MIDSHYKVSLTFLEATRKLANLLDSSQATKYSAHLDRLESNLGLAYEANNTQDLLSSCKELIAIGETLVAIHRNGQ